MAVADTGFVCGCDVLSRFDIVYTPYVLTWPNVVDQSVGLVIQIGSGIFWTLSAETCASETTW
eukprot:4082795-Amphidinium_carterae.1